MARTLVTESIARSTMCGPQRDENLVPMQADTMRCISSLPTAKQELVIASAQAICGTSTPLLHVLVLHVDGHGDLLSRLDGDLERLAVGRHDHGGVDVTLQEGLGQSQHLAGCGKAGQVRKLIRLSLEQKHTA